MNKFILDKAMVGVKSSAPLREEGGISFEVPNSRLERLSSLSLGQLGASGESPCWVPHSYPFAYVLLVWKVLSIAPLGYFLLLTTAGGSFAQL